MANSASIIFKHRKKNVKKVNAYRLLKDGTFDAGKELQFGEKWKILLPGPEATFVLECVDDEISDDIIVKESPGLQLSILKKSKKRWELKIKPDNEQPLSPTTVNVSLDDDDSEDE
ncbi:MAG: hypothetical protein GY757_17590 [bacterium]|nr:hypothetical protein [bacterium]